MPTEMPTWLSVSLCVCFAECVNNCLLKKVCQNVHLPKAVPSWLTSCLAKFPSVSLNASLPTKISEYLAACLPDSLSLCLPASQLSCLTLVCVQQVAVCMTACFLNVSLPERLNAKMSGRFLPNSFLSTCPLAYLSPKNACRNACLPVCLPA